MVKVITYILRTNATVQSLVGLKSESQTDDYHKVYPVVVPQGEKAPYIAVRMSGRVRIGKDCDSNYSVQVVSYHNSYDEVTALNEAVISALESATASTINGQDFSFANLSGEVDEYVKEHNLYAKVTTFEGTAA
jgi:hypothetical protein